MKRVIFMSLLMLAMLPAISQQSRLWLGGDISMLPALQKQGAIYCDMTGNPVDPYTLFSQQGWNMMRVRLFVDPANAPVEHRGQGVCQDLDYVLDLCRTIKQRGFEIMLDFHYSDTWADPAKQFTPARWQGKPLPDSIYAYTKRCLTQMVRNGVEPRAIQVGNEITFGMDWPTGRVDPMDGKNWGPFLDMLKAGCRACREVCPSAKIIIHTEKAGKWDMTHAFYKRLEDAKLDYDIIGLSYYPMWHGTLNELSYTLDKLATTFPKHEVMIVEAAYYYQHDGVNRGEEDFSCCPPGTIEGQQKFTAELVHELKQHKNVTGLFWWYPEENTHGIATRHHGGLNRGLFDNSNGHALPALYELARYRDLPKPELCPKCHSARFAKMLYGYIDTQSWSPEKKAELKAGKIALGGCVIEPDSPLFYCLDCRFTLGRFSIPR